MNSQAVTTASVGLLYLEVKQEVCVFASQISAEGTWQKAMGPTEGRSEVSAAAADLVYQKVL